MKVIVLKIILVIISEVTAGISPIHDLKERMGPKIIGDKLVMNSPHKVLKHLDESILRATKNVTQNPQMEESLYQLSKDLVTAILSKLEIQDKITRITKEALEAPGKNKGVTAIETRRILDYISRTLSGHILTITRASTESELHRLVYGLSQIAAETSIVSALKDITYSTALSKKQSIDLSLRRKRAIDENDPKQHVAVTTSAPILKNPSTVYHSILNNNLALPTYRNTSVLPKANVGLTQNYSPYSVIPLKDKTPVHIIDTKQTPVSSTGFLNKTALDVENSNDFNDSDSIVLEKSINATHYERIESNPTLDAQELEAPALIDDWADLKENLFKPSINADVLADIEIDRPDVDDEAVNVKKVKQKQEKLEVKAKKAILYAGDVAYLTAASVVALRRALTASIEVQMSVKYAKNSMSNHQELMMNLAKTAAQQAGKESKVATSKALACEKVSKLALKYTAQSEGANLNHVANRIVMDTLPLATLAKSMAFVSADIAMNSLYLATDVKHPS